MPALSAACAKVRRSSNRVASGRPAYSTWSKSPHFIRPTGPRFGVPLRTRTRVPRAPLRLGDLRNRHLEGYRIAHPPVELGLLPTRAGGRQVEPHMGGHVILGDALAFVVQKREQILRARP